MDSAPQNLSSLIDNNDDLLQKKLDSFIKELQYLGLSQEQIENLVMSLSSTATKQTMAKISSVMSEDDWDKWKKFVDTGPNTAQQIMVMNTFLEKKINKDLETIHSEIIDGLIENTLEEIASTKDLSLKVSQLTPEEIEKAKKLLDEGDYDGADRVINKEE
jgi:hypothetical protein